MLCVRKRWLSYRWLFLLRSSSCFIWWLSLPMTVCAVLALCVRAPVPMCVYNTIQYKSERDFHNHRHWNLLKHVVALCFFPAIYQSILIVPLTRIIFHHFFRDQFYVWLYKNNQTQTYTHSYTYWNKWKVQLNWIKVGALKRDRDLPVLENVHINKHGVNETERKKNNRTALEIASHIISSVWMQLHWIYSIVRCLLMLFLLLSSLLLSIGWVSP